LQDAYPQDWQNDLAAAWLAASYKLLKQDDEANRLMAGPEKALVRSEASEKYFYSYYYDPLVRDATVLYLLSKHFPDRVKALPPRVFENLAWPLAHDDYNTLSSSMTILALDSYASQTSGELDKLGIQEVHADGSAKTISSIQGNLLQAGSWDASASKLRFINQSTLPAWHVVSQGGYDSRQPSEAIKNGIEVIRDYTDDQGKAVDSVTVGQEINVHVRIRATGDDGVGNVAVVDLLPGGFEPVIEPPPVANGQQNADNNSGDNNGGDNTGSDAGDNGNSDSGNGNPPPTPAWRSTIGLPQSTWQLDYADIREDRVVIYGTATPDVHEFVYRIRATNAGKFVVPPAYAESMYDRSIQARSAGGAALTVVDKP
jgi:uncharacterized protein YfaS (alpha-2-macroglobulin family)